ncbi:Nucleotide exchange factor SIL1 [Hondaea fermentalgiana]|uniref:Nucleotide exchange factor SIL1 n=1 Tax=Hondaea fermentalgiana TaxID=2315210 RepID=A0A2R5GS71_9STRA|nr:Nucleotide exchange factor SIL1 [Hondaea fermentalgiana]|eukprot:GBG31201.1 Nucleotide exchange factor SIL1 [Hondaea fermentalgiana]
MRGATTLTALLAAVSVLTSCGAGNSPAATATCWTRNVREETLPCADRLGDDQSKDVRAREREADPAERKAFVVSRSWQTIEPWHQIPIGLDVRLDFEAGKRHARIPDPWKLRVQISLLDMRATVLTTNAWLPTSSSAPWNIISSAIRTDLRIVQSCLLRDDTLGSLAAAKSVEELFAITNGRVYLKARVGGDYACLCGTAEPCRGPRDAQKQCESAYAEIATKSDNARPDACSKQRRAYAECATKCSAFQDTILLDRDLFQDSVEAIEQSKLVQQEERATLFGGMMSSWCQNCGFSRGKVVFAFGEDLYPRAKAADATEWTIGKSMYETYMRHADLGRTEASGSPMIQCAEHAAHPVVLVSVWSLKNVHRLLADLIIPVWSTLHDAGIGPARATLFLDLGDPVERAKMQQILRDRHPSQKLSTLSLLRLMFREVHSTEALRITSEEKTYCFANLFVEATAMHFHRHARDENTHNQSGQGAIFRRELQTRLKRVWPSPFDENGGIEGVVSFVKRRGTREFTNLREAKAVAKKVFEPLGITIQDLVLERLSFDRQWSHFQRTRVLCCVHGQGCANMVFLPERSVVILVMPMGTSKERETYTAMARWLGLRLVLHEVSKDVDRETNGTFTGSLPGSGSEPFVNRDPRWDQDIILEPEAWRHTLRKALIALVDM